MAAYDRPAGTWAGLCWPQFAKVVSALAPVAAPVIPTVAMAATSDRYFNRRTMDGDPLRIWRPPGEGGRCVGGLQTVTESAPCVNESLNDLLPPAPGNWHVDRPWLKRTGLHPRND